MSVILVIVGLVFGTYLYQPLWFDDTPYHYQSTHETLKDCEVAKSGHIMHGQDGVCVGESPCVQLSPLHNNIILFPYMQNYLLLSILIFY